MGATWAACREQTHTAKGWLRTLVRESFRGEPTSARRLGLATLLVERGAVDAAAAELRQAIALDPSSVAAHYHLGTLLIDAGKSAEAVVACGHAARTLAGEALLHVNYGLALESCARYEEAAAALTRAVELGRPGFDIA